MRFITIATAFLTLNTVALADTVKKIEPIMTTEELCAANPADQHCQKSKTARRLEPITKLEEMRGWMLQPVMTTEELCAANPADQHCKDTQ